VEFENTFAVGAPIDEVWDTVLDIERVAPCMPGAQVLERTGDDAYKVSVKVKLGPISMLYKGDVEILERDTSTHRALMRAKAMEARGQGTAEANIEMTLAEQADETRATIRTEMQLSGKAAAMGQGVIKDVAAALVATFAENLAGSLSAGGAPEAPAAATAPADGPPPAPSQPPGREPPSEAASLSVADVATSVITARMKDPRTRTIAITIGAGMLLVIGLRLARRAR
jgi:carbon monoxide dehydrogenase subunit G